MNHISKPKPVAILTILLVCIALTGCSDDETPLDPAPELPTYDSPQALMQGMRTIFEAMDITNFPSLLYADFRMYLQASTVQEFGLPRDYFDHAEELDIHANIFSGEPLDTGSGMVAGVTGITFATFEAQLAWSTAPSTDPNFPGQWYAPFNIKFEFERAGATTLIVQGIINVYIHEDAGRSGDGRDATYTLLGIVDLTQNKNTEGNSWGEVQTIYRSPEVE